MRDGLRNYFLDKAFIAKIGKNLSKKLMNLVEPTYWSLQHWDAYYTEKGNLKPIEEQGFDVIVGNPPWEILKPDVDEFFSPLHNSEDTSKFSLLTKNKKKAIMHDLLKNPDVATKWEEYKNDISTMTDYFKNFDFQYQYGEVDGKKISGDFNLYKLFLEKSYSLLKKGGLCGIVIPSNFYSDLGAKGLRKLLFRNAEIQSLFSFDNKKKIFEDLHRQYKFMTFVFRTGEPSRTFKAAFYVRDIGSLQNLENNCVIYDLDLIERTSPMALSLIECNSQYQIDLIKKLFKFPLLLDKSIWNIKLSREFDMTNDANLFNTEGDGGILYEGKMIHQFMHNLAKPRYWIRNNLAEKKLRNTLIKKLQTNENKDNNNSGPQVKFNHNEYRLGWRSVGRATDQRTMIGTILPKGVYLGNSIIFVKPFEVVDKKFVKMLSTNKTLYLCGMINSFVTDFILRQKVAANVNMFYVYELPVPKFEEKDSIVKDIVKRVGMLVCTSPEFDFLKEELKIGTGEIDPNERIKLISQINAYVAKVYHLTKEEFEYILQTFPIVEDELKRNSLEEFELLS